MLIKEFRIVLPLSLEEYQVAQLFTVAETSKEETGGGEGVEVIKNEPFTNQPQFFGQYSSGQYTLKIYHIEQKLPKYLRLLAKNVFEFREEAWNAYPYCKTIITNSYMKDDFILKIETIHLPDRGNAVNPHKLDPETLKNVEIVPLDITDDNLLPKSDLKPNMDPKYFKSAKTGRGPYRGNWKETVQPVMCCYKLVTVNFKWFGLQTKVESFIMNTEKRLFTKFHRELVCSMDKWYGLTMKDIRSMEEATKYELDKQRNKAGLAGTTNLE